MNDQQIEVRLNTENIWRLFDQHINEMIITKTGRRIYPHLEYDIKHLDADANYMITFTMERVDQNRYKYTSGEWEAVGTGELPPPPQPIRVGDTRNGILTGREWMERPVMVSNCFKLTNNQAHADHTKGTPQRSSSTQGVRESRQGVRRTSQSIFMNSMHKYIPVLRIFRVFNHEPFVPIKEVRFDFTKFVAVTCYQNESITKLKIQLNPFAKGFRGDSRKRSSCSPSDDDSHDGASNNGSPGTKVSRSTTAAGLMAEPKEYSPTLPVCGEPKFDNWTYPVPQMSGMNMGYPLANAPTNPPMQNPWYSHLPYMMNMQTMWSNYPFPNTSQYGPMNEMWNNPQMSPEMHMELFQTPPRL